MYGNDRGCWKGTERFILSAFDEVVPHSGWPWPQAEFSGACAQGYVETTYVPL